jgi:hypothetical protein
MRIKQLVCAPDYCLFVKALESVIAVECMYLFCIRMHWCSPVHHGLMSRDAFGFTLRARRAATLSEENPRDNKSRQKTKKGSVNLWGIGTDLVVSAGFISWGVSALTTSQYLLAIVNSVGLIAVVVRRIGILRNREKVKS